MKIKKHQSGNSFQQISPPLIGNVDNCKKIRVDLLKDKSFPPAIRVLVVDDLKAARNDIKDKLKQFNDIEIIGEANNGQEAIEQYERLLPDIVLMNKNMPIMDGFAATKEICNRHDKAKIIMVSVCNEPCYWREALLAGVLDYIAKPPEADKLIKSIRFWRTEFNGIREDYGIILWQNILDIFKSVGDIPYECLTEASHSPHKTECFDINKLIEAFPKVQLDDGYVLDYVYATDGFSGEPLIYARSIEADPILTPDEYWDTFSIHKPSALRGNEPTGLDSHPYLQHVKFEKSPFGFLEFALFCMLIRRFYLRSYSHFNTRVFLFSFSDIKRLAINDTSGITLEDIKNHHISDLRPIVRRKGDGAEVIIKCFEGNIGYSDLHILIQWPNSFHEIQDEVIIKSKVEKMYQFQEIGFPGIIEPPN